MDRTDIAAQQARLAEYRKQQNNLKQPNQPTSAAKSIDPEGQPFKEQAPVKHEFEKAHDHAIVNAGEKKGDQVSPQLREQDAAKPKPGGMDGPTPPQSTGKEAIRQAEMEKLKQTKDQAKARQDRGDRGNMKDGKDHD